MDCVTDLQGMDPHIHYTDAIPAPLLFLVS